MQVPGFKVPTGNVYRVEGKRRAVWYARYRLAAGREVGKRIGPAWTGRGRPAAGYFTKRTAEAWLSDVLDQARRGTLPGAVRTGATFAAPPPPRLHQCRTAAAVGAIAGARSSSPAKSSRTDGRC